MKPKFVVLLVFVLSMVSLTYSSEIGRQNAFTKVDAPAIYYNQKALLKSASFKYQIDYSTDFPYGEIRNALEKAMEIWSYILSSAQPIRIYIKKADLSDNIFASTKTNFYNFPEGTNIQGVRLGFHYPMTLAKSLANSDLNAGFAGDERYDMIITVNNKILSSNGFSFNLDGEPISGKLDFITIIMHEIGHGLGITGSMKYNSTTNEGSYSYCQILAQKDMCFPTIFDNFAIEGHQGQDDDRLINNTSYPNPSGVLGRALISDSLYFDGAKSKSAAQNAFPKLYAPTTWQQGSSFVHLDEKKYCKGNSNSLMTYRIDLAEVIHSPGEICLAMLADIGWTINRCITVVSPAPGNVWVRNYPDSIFWTDNRKEQIDIVLYQKSSDKFYQASTINSIIANDEIIGMNVFPWTIGANVTDGLYKIKFQVGNEVYGESGEFAISDEGRVATPIISPSNNTYITTAPITVTITCQTQGAEIYYTINGAIPDQNSNRYRDTIKFSVVPPCTVKAKAYKGELIPSDLTTVFYDYDANGVVIVKLDEQGQEFGVVNDRDYNCVYLWDRIGNWYSQYITYPFDRRNEFTIKVEQYLIPNKSGVFQKFWKWQTNKNDIYLSNWGIYDLSTINTFTAHFKTPYTAKIQTALEGFPSLTGDEIYFKDPWKYDTTKTTDRKGFTNSGKNAIPKLYSSPLIISPTSDLKGVLLDINALNTGTTYSVKAKSDVIINGTLRKFVDWSSDGKATLLTPNNIESDVIYHAPDANVYARYKFVNKSNTATAFSNTSQRKFVRTDNGCLHLVYESMNHIWYERSTDNGGSWQIMNNGKYLDGGTTPSKLPSIATIFNDIAIVWQEEYEGCYKIKLARFDENSVKRYTTEVYNSFNSGMGYDTRARYITDADPVIAFNRPYMVLVCWKKELPEHRTDHPEWSGIYYKLGSVGVQPYGEIVDDSQWFEGGLISGSSIDSYTPTVTAASSDYSFGVAWEQRGYQSSIKYSELQYEYEDYDPYTNKYFYIVYPIKLETVSDWSYYQKHSKPSIALVGSPGAGGNSIELSWVGERIYYENGIQKTSRDALYRRNSFSPSAYSWSWAGTTWSLGNSSVNAVNVNTSNNDGVIGWNESSGRNYYIRASNPFSTKLISNGPDLKGASLQLNNSTDLNTMYALVFDNSSLPYSFVRSFPVSQIGKTGLGAPSSRIAIARKDSAVFYISAARLSLDENSIGYSSKTDSLKHFDCNSIGEILSSGVFTPKDNSKISYELEYGALDTLNALKTLAKEDGISCNLVLYDVENKTAIKVVEKFSLIKNSIKESEISYKKISGSIDVKKFANRQLRLQLAIEDGIHANWGIMERVLNPEEQRQAEKMEIEKVTEYTLSQNYPNPFNPTTMISYALPRASMVSLKIYDLLGKEVKTLVNEYKTEGRYSAFFNASGLPSGTYIYEIRADAFVKSGKMMLLK